MSTSPIITGSAFRAGLPPGVYEDRPSTRRAVDVRMDVAAFVGLTERGPVCTPVVVESVEGFVRAFGRAGGGRLLPQSLVSFFANGGRRAVVCRAVDAVHAARGTWRLPDSGAGLVRAGGSPIDLLAADPGRWADDAEMSFSWTRRGLAEPWRAPDAATYPDEAALGADVVVTEPPTEVGVGTLVRLVRAERPANAPEVLHEELLFVEGVAEIDEQRVAITLSAPLVPEMQTEDVLFAAQEITLDVEIRTPGHVERYERAALDPSHPRYLPHLLQPESDDVDLSRRGEGDGLPPGSLLVRVAADHLAERWLPAQPLTAESGSFRVGPEHLTVAGTDGEVEHDRSHFFRAPLDVLRAELTDAEIASSDGRYDFASRPAPLDALDEYDAHHETAPISLVTMPDLVHPTQVDALESLSETDAPPPGTRFGQCTYETTVSEPQDLVYPNLALTGGLDDVRDVWQLALVQWCEARADRIAILDLPPTLDAGAVLRWRRAVASDRAALYAPYLRVERAEDPDAPPLVLPPGGAVCGVVARREARLGVHAAPANERVEGLVDLYDDGIGIDAGFLHDERVNETRLVETGPTLLGSRTTSHDRDFTHVSVRRLIDYLERQLALDTRWAVFEPNDRALWMRLRRAVERRLRRLFDRGAFAGGSPAEAWFVRCDGHVNDQATRDAGRVVVQVGVAPSVPAEFIVFRLVHLRDGGQGDV